MPESRPKPAVPAVLVRASERGPELGLGDFMGFPTPSLAHHLRNPFTEDLVYLSGGEKRDVEVADFPTLGKRMVRLGKDVTLYPLSAGAPFPGD